MSLHRSVFSDETKLDINYVPHRLPHREKELALLKEFFSFVLNSPEKMAQRVIVTGDVGTGKTAICQRFGADVTREAGSHGINLRYVHVNCREYRGSLFMIMQHLISVFYPHFPRRGYSAEELLQALMQVLDEEKTCIILSLDEFDSMVQREGSEAVYELTRLQETRQNKPQRLSLICILRNLDAIQKLDASARSTLQFNVVNLGKYSRQQLVDILNDRVIAAFKPSTVPEDTLRLIAELAESENGNARFGIELLWRAGKYANAEDLVAATPECARKAVSSVMPAVRRSEIASCSLHERLFLLGIARLFRREEKAFISLTEAEQAYKVACEEYDKKPNSHTQLWKYLQGLSASGIVKTEVSSSGSRGRSTIVFLPRIPASQLEEQLQALLRKIEV